MKKWSVPFTVQCLYKRKEAAAFMYRTQTEMVTRTFEEIYGTESTAFTTNEKDLAIHQALNGSYIRQELIKAAFKETDTVYSTIDYMSLIRNKKRIFLEDPFFGTFLVG